MSDPLTRVDLFGQMARDGWADETSGKAADEARRRVNDAIAKDVPGAQVLYDAAAHEGFRRDWLRFARGARQQFRSHDGRVLAAREAYMQPVRDDQGRKTGGYQLNLLMAMTRDDLREALADRQKQHEQLGDVVQIMQRLLLAWDEFPHAQTVRDLLAAAGIDASSDLIEGIL